MKPTQVKLTLLATISLIVWMGHSLAVAAGMSAAQSPIKEDPGKADSPEINRAIAVTCSACRRS